MIPAGFVSGGIGLLVLGALTWWVGAQLDRAEQVARAHPERPRLPVLGWAYAFGLLLAFFMVAIAVYVLAIRVATEVPHG